MLTVLCRGAVVVVLVHLGAGAQIRGGISAIPTLQVDTDLAGFETGDVPNEPPIEVWISSFPRSGSSTVLSMVGVSAKMVRSKDGSYGGALVSNDVFTLFEPCHDPGDEPFEPDCAKSVAKFAACDFSGQTALWGWDDLHTTNGGLPYSPELASQYCQQATRRAFKTVGQTFAEDYGRRLQNMLWVLEQFPNMKIINLVRDPRGLLASWKTTDFFEIDNDMRQVPAWKEMCDTLATNLETKHPRVLTVVYEHMVYNPEQYMKELYDFLGFEFGETQERWLANTFPDSLSSCPQRDAKIQEFSDCQGRQESAAELDHWRTILSEDEKQKIHSYEPCKRVFEAFGYPWM